MDDGGALTSVRWVAEKLLPCCARPSIIFVTSMFVFGVETLKTPFRDEIVTSTVRFWHDLAAARVAKATGRVAETSLTISTFEDESCETV